MEWILIILLNTPPNIEALQWTYPTEQECMHALELAEGVEVLESFRVAMYCIKVE